MMRFLRNIIPLVLVGLCLDSANAYSEFQAFVVKHAGRPINCAMCHTHPDGPNGAAPGQIWRLTPAELEQLGRARAAFTPGQNVDSPILNAFGDHIVNSLGKQKVIELKLAPEQLATALPQDSDLDRDGIPDVREYLDGTNPVNHNDGHPWLLFKNNLRNYLFQISLTLAATVAGLWGLGQLLHGFATATRLNEDTADETQS